MTPLDTSAIERVAATEPGWRRDERREALALVEKLGQAGVTFESQVKSVPDSQVTYSGGVRKRLVYFRDPEDNILELCEYK